MTLNIGSNKISRLAIGQADGTVKEISQLNLGNKIIFQHRGQYTPNFPIPTIATDKSYVLHLMYFNQIKDQIQSFTLKSRSSQSTDLLYIFYDTNSSTPNETISIPVNGSVNLMPYLANLKNGSALVYTITNTNAKWSQFESTEQPLIQILDSSNNALGCVKLSQIPNLTYYLRYGTDLEVNAFEHFNDKGSIVDMNDDCFILPSACTAISFTKQTTEAGHSAFDYFNKNGRLRRVPPTAFSTVNLKSQYNNIFFFNGDANSIGDLENAYLDPTLEYNENYKNQSSAKYIYTKKGNYQVSMGQPFKWRTNPL